MLATLFSKVCRIYYTILYCFALYDNALYCIDALISKHCCEEQFVNILFPWIDSQRFGLKSQHVHKSSKNAPYFTVGRQNLSPEKLSNLIKVLYKDVKMLELAKQQMIRMLWTIWIISPVIWSKIQTQFLANKCRVPHKSRVGVRIENNIWWSALMYYGAQAQIQTLPTIWYNNAKIFPYFILSQVTTFVYILICQPHATRHCMIF